MSRSANIELRWGDGVHFFRLGIAQLAELQEKCDAGPPLVLARLSNSAWRVEDIREAIRLGLIGGGMAPRGASKLVERYVDSQDPPLAEHVITAEAIVAAAIVGHEDEPAPKPAGEEKAPPDSSPAVKSAGANITAPARPSD